MLQTIDKNKFPTTDEMFGWIKEMCRWEHRKTGTPESLKSAEYIAGKFREFGLEEVEIEKVPSMCMFVDKCELSIDGEKLDTMFANGTNRASDEGTFTFGSSDSEDEFIYLGKGLEDDFDKVDVAGKIVVCDIYFRYMPVSMFEEMIPDELVEQLIYDPHGRLKNAEPILDIYSPNNWPYNYFYAQLKGVKGFVGILQDYVDDPDWYSEDYTFFGEDMGIEFMKLPGMWLSKSTGEALKSKFAEKGVLKGNMQMTSRYEYKDALNVKGIIKGESDEIVLMHSHHDAVYAGGVQDASGMSTVLALAEYFAAPGNKKSDKTYMFGAMDSHFTDYNGHEGFIKRRKELGDKLIYDFVVEHVGKDVCIENGEFKETGEGVPKLMYVSAADPEMIMKVREEIAKYDIDKTIIMPVEHEEEADYTSDSNVISDANLFETEGINIVSMVSSPAYLFHPSDTPDRVMKEWLQPIGMMYAELMESV